MFFSSFRFTGGWRPVFLAAHPRETKARFAFVSRHPAQGNIPLGSCQNKKKKGPKIVSKAFKSIPGLWYVRNVREAALWLALIVCGALCNAVQQLLEGEF